MKRLHFLGISKGTPLAKSMISSKSSSAAPPYAVHPDTITALRAYTGKTVKLVPFTSDKPGKSEIMCRLVGMIQTPNGEPFEEYVYNAFRSEMLIAGLAANTAPVTLGGHLVRMHFTTGSEAVWELQLTLTSSNGRPLTVAEDSEFNWHFIGDHACREVTTAMPLAVQSLIRKTVQHPDFPALLTPGTMPATNPTAPAPNVVAAAPSVAIEPSPMQSPTSTAVAPDLCSWAVGKWRSLGRSNELEITPSLRWEWQSSSGGYWTGRGRSEVVEGTVLLLQGWHSTSVPMMLRLRRAGDRLAGKMQTSRSYRIMFEREGPQ